MLIVVLSEAGKVKIGGELLLMKGLWLSSTFLVVSLLIITECILLVLVYSR